MARYAAGGIDRVAAWSVEAHLTGCESCRSAVSAYVDPERLSRNRIVMLVRLATPEPGALRRLSRCGLPDHVARLLAATPSLRVPWLLSVLGALMVLTAEAALAAHVSAGPVRLSDAGGQVLLPFVLAAPLLVLVAVAGAFVPMFDPAHRLEVAAPFSGFTLLLVRTASALLAVLVPVVAAAVVVPGPGWLPAALLLPSLALSAVALATAAVLGPRTAAVTAATCWAVAVLWVAAVQRPLLVLHWHGQAACAVALLVAVTVLALRRDRLEMGWTR